MTLKELHDDSQQYFFQPLLKKWDIYLRSTIVISFLISVAQNKLLPLKPK